MFVVLPAQTARSVKSQTGAFCDRSIKTPVALAECNFSPGVSSAKVCHESRRLDRKFLAKRVFRRCRFGTSKHASTLSVVTSSNQITASRQAKESQNLSQQRLEDELDELGKELMAVERTLDDLNRLIEQAGNPDKYGPLRVKLHLQAAAIEEAKARLEEDLSSLRSDREGEPSSLARRTPGVRPKADVSQKFGEAVSDIWQQVKKALQALSEEINTSKSEARTELEADLEALEAKLKALSKRRKEFERKEEARVEAILAGETDGNAVAVVDEKKALESLRVELLEDAKQKQILDEELAQLADELERLRERMVELESSGTVISIDVDSVKAWAVHALDKAKETGLFYVRGAKLLCLDFIVAGKIFQGVIFQGRPFSTRDSSHLRRLVTDMFALVPFSVLLAIPLSPVGHAFLFALIQKYVPALMPSTFQSSRVKVLERFERQREHLDAGEAASASLLPSSAPPFPELDQASPKLQKHADKLES